MRKSVASLTHKLVAALAALTLACSMVPAAWADDGSAATAAGIAAGNAESASSAESGAAPDTQEVPEPSAQSADAKAASGSAGAGTAVRIEVYRSSYPLVWNLNDESAADEVKATWSGADGRSAPAGWPSQGSPGTEVGTYEDYVEWTDDANPGSEPKRLGFNFMGWSTEPDIAVEGAGKLDTLRIPQDAPIVEGRITLYALWAPIEYSVVFDLTKNPEDASAVPSFTWVDADGDPLKGAGGFSDLGGGRYRLAGVTLEDYDPATGLIEIATPARGSGGYRFLSWAEPDNQQDPAVAVMRAGSSKWFVNPVALPHYDYEPVLTARWALSFDVDVPSKVTFDQYDRLQIEGNLSDTTEQNTVDEESPDAHDAGKQAHFCSQSTACDYKIVALESVRQEAADEVLTTSDSAKASKEQVLGSEKLLSLFAEGAPSEDQGVHFKLDDTIDMDDSARYGAFVIPKQDPGFDASATDRDDESRLYVSYRLNLSNAVDGSPEPNHGLVTPGDAAERERIPIAEVSYEFAVADDEVESSAGSEQVLFIKDGNVTYGLDYIKRAAEDLSANGTSSKYYAQFKGWLDAQVMQSTKEDVVAGKVIYGTGPYFQLKVDGRYLPLQLIGICQDTKTAGGKAGLTFQMRDIYACDNKRSNAAGGGAFNYTYMNSTNTNAGGWNSSALRSRLRSTFWGYLPQDVRDAIVPVTKYQQARSTEIDSATGADLQRTTNEVVWIPSVYEVFGTVSAGYNDSEALTSVAGYVPFQYMAYQPGGTSTINRRTAKAYNGSGGNWWLRSSYRADGNFFSRVNPGGGLFSISASSTFGAAPCFCL